MSSNAARFLWSAAVKSALNNNFTFRFQLIRSYLAACRLSVIIALKVVVSFIYMNINLKAAGFRLTPSIRENVMVKLAAIEKLISKFDDEGEIELDFEVSKTTRHHNKGDIFYAEANLELPKKLIRAESTKDELGAAIDEVKERLSEAVKKYKALNNQ